MGPIIVQVGRRASGLVFGLHPLKPCHHSVRVSRCERNGCHSFHQFRDVAGFLDHSWQHQGPALVKSCRRLLTSSCQNFNSWATPSSRMTPTERSCLCDPVTSFRCKTILD